MEINKITDCVLLLDDDSVNGFINAQLLSRLGIANTVKASSTAMEAIKFLRECCILEEGELNSLLIFLDLHATTYNGTEFLELVNSTTNNVLEKVEIIILTAFPDAKENYNGTGLNVLGFIEKPLTTEKLQKILPISIQADQTLLD